MNLPTLKIVSGGQTGAHRAALDWAIEHGIEHGDLQPERMVMGKPTTSTSFRRR